MTIPTGPLAAQLRLARGKMLGKDLAAAAGWQPPKVSKIEKGRQLPTPQDLQVWAEVTGAGQNALAQWIAMLTQIQADRHRMSDALRAGIVAQQRSFTEIIESCTEFYFYEKVVMPRFLQTPAFTRGLLAYSQQVHRPDLDLSTPEAQADLDAGVAERQASTRYLYDTERRFEFILDEAVLRSWRFDADTMRAQLVKIQSCIGLPNIRIGIIPQNRFLHTLALNSFDMYGDEAVFVETFIGEDPQIRDEDIQSYRDWMSRLWTDAVEGDEAYALIDSARAAIPH